MLVCCSFPRPALHIIATFELTLCTKLAVPLFGHGDATSEGLVTRAVQERSRSGDRSDTSGEQTTLDV